MGHLNEIPKKKTAEGCTIVVDVHLFHKGEVPEPEGGGGGGIGISVGQQVNGGGVVTGTTNSTVTIRFPDGVPDGPITVRGSETTVVIEHVDPGGGQEGDGIVIAPWGPTDDIPVPSVDPGTQMSGNDVPPGRIIKSFKLPTPGSLANTIRLPDEFHNFIIMPTNTSTCPCAIFLGSIDANGKISKNTIILDPGQSVPSYEAEPGAAGIVAAASGGCKGQGCVAQLTIFGHASNNQ